MLAQDTLTGALYEVPELYGWGEYPEFSESPYDGLGFPLPLLGPLISAGASLLPKIFGGGGGPAPAPPAPTAIPAIPGIPNLGNILGRLRGIMGGMFPRPIRYFAPPPPFGWIRPTEPYTGPDPRRLQMRCSLWPGPAGLVPAQVGTFGPAVAPGAVPGLPGVAPVPGAFGLRRRRRLRRRR